MSDKSVSITINLSNSSNIIVEFMQDNQPQIAWLLQENAGKARLMLPNRREANIATARLLPWSGPSYSEKNKDEIVQLLQDHKDARTRIENDLDIMSLWEMTQGEVEEESAFFFAELMQNNTNIDIVVAFAHALLKNKTLFKFHSPNFEVYTQEIVNAKIEAQASADEKEILVGTAANWFNFLWSLHQSNKVYNQEKQDNIYDLIDEYTTKNTTQESKEREKEAQSNHHPIQLNQEMEARLKHLLLKRISDPESHDDDLFWKQITKQLPDDPHLALLLATSWGIIPSHYNYWLSRAGFEPSAEFYPANTKGIQELIEVLQHVDDNDKTRTIRNYIEQNLTQDTKNIHTLQQSTSEVKSTSLNLSALSNMGNFANFATPHKNTSQKDIKDNPKNAQKKQYSQSNEHNKKAKQEILQHENTASTENAIKSIKFPLCLHDTPINPSMEVQPPTIDEINNKTQTLPFFPYINEDTKKQKITTFFAPFLDKPFISIDSAATKDIDDAFTLTKAKNGDYEIYIALACPVCIWEFNSPFDKQILQRSTSLYLPEATYHMMPHTLATELFSLKEKSIRPALISYTRVSPTGEILESSWDFMRIQVADNLHYNACEHIFKIKMQVTKDTQNQENDTDTMENQEFLAHIETLDKQAKEQNRASSQNSLENYPLHTSYQHNPKVNTVLLYSKVDSTANNEHNSSIEEASATNKTSVLNEQCSMHEIAYTTIPCEEYDTPSQAILNKTMPYEETLLHAYEFAQARLAHRISQGSVIIEKDEMHIRLENREDRVSEHNSNLHVDKDTAVFIDYIPQNPKAQLIVSELMILANASLANFAALHNIPLFFRTQDLALPKEFAGIWRKPEEIAKIARSLSAAKTSTSPRPHAGLGLKAYSPVTSPLRRYADLINEAQLMRFLYTQFCKQTNSHLETLPNTKDDTHTNTQIRTQATTQLGTQSGTENPLLWTKEELDALLFNFNIHHDAVSQVQRMRPRYWRFVAIAQEAKRHGEKCGFHAIISDENDTHVTVTLTREQLIVRAKRSLFGDKALTGQEVFVRLGKINPLRGEMTILAVQDA